MDWRKEDKKTHRIILFFFIFFVISCAKNYKTIYREINATRDIEQQIEIIGKIKNEFFLYNYTKGLLFFNNARYDSSFYYLERADKYRRKRFNNKTIKNIKSILLNTTNNEYFGEDYEDLFINYYKALILSQKNNFIESGVEARIISQKLKLFNTLYRNINSEYNYQTNYPFAEFIAGIFYYLQGDYNDAYISLKTADSLYNTKSYEIAKPIYMEKLLSFIDSLLKGKAETNRNIKFIFFQEGTIDWKRDKTIYHNINVDKRIYQIKISYPYMVFSKSKKIDIVLNNNKYSIFPQENLSERASIMLENKKNLIVNTAILQANIKLLIAMGTGELVYGITKNILKDKEKKQDKNKKKNNKQKKNENREQDIENIANTMGCIVGTATNQYLNNLTKADMREIFLLPNSIYIIPVMNNEKIIKINGKDYSINSKKVQIINDY